MSIKSEVVNKEENKEIDYPCLMISDSSYLIVLMEESRSGTVIVGGSNHAVGYVCGNWAMESFSIFNGEVVLRNK